MDAWGSEGEALMGGPGGRVFAFAPTRTRRDDVPLDVLESAEILPIDDFRAGVVRLGPGMDLILKLPAFRYRVKRAMDVVISGLTLVLLFPVFVAISVAVKLSSEGPVFFRQSRVGRNGNRFDVLKFRTMHVGAAAWLQDDLELTSLYEANHFKVPASLDPRVTPLGRLLRRASLDELPQLLNVFLGHMSLVGPRPVVPDELQRYESLIPAYLAVRPGITGAWQVGGRSSVGYPQRAVIDFTYVVRWSLFVDLTILVRTIPVVLGRKGAY